MFHPRIPAIVALLIIAVWSSSGIAQDNENIPLVAEKPAVEQKPYDQIVEARRIGGSEAICSQLATLIDQGKAEKAGVYLIPKNEYAYFLSNWEGEANSLTIYPITKTELDRDIKQGVTSLSGATRFNVFSFTGKWEVATDNLYDALVTRMKRLDPKSVKHSFSIKMAPYVLDCEGLVVIGTGQSRTARVTLGGLYANPTSVLFWDVLSPQYLKKYNIDTSKLPLFPMAHYYSGEAENITEYLELYGPADHEDSKSR